MHAVRTKTRSLATLTFAVAGLFILGCGSDGATGPQRGECPDGQVRVEGECVRDTGRDTGPDVIDSDTDSDVESDAEDTSTDVVDPDATEDTTPDVAADTEIDTGLGCNDGAQRCFNGGPQRCAGDIWVDAVACTGGTVCAGGQCVNAADCTPGDIIGCASTSELLQCNAAGDNYDIVPCDGGLSCFQGECGTQICDPGQRQCDGDFDVEVCDSTGEGWEFVETCDQLDDLVCALGDCVSGCAAVIKDATYVGCEYWSVDLPQYQDPFGDPRAVPHAVVVSNVGTRPAEITVSTNSGIPLVTETLTVQPGDVGTINFPRADVEDTSRSVNSFRISSSEPVVAYQFNPLNDVGVASNDASLLLPVNALGREYYIMSWPSGIGFGSFAPQTGWFTIVATSPDVTEVTIEFSAKLIDGVDADLQGITAGSTHTFEMRQWDVMNFEAETTFGTIGDLTGTHVVSNNPLVVFSGHEEAVVGEGEDVCCADHLEQQLFPVTAWRERYLAAHSPRRGTEPDNWRIIASRDGTRVTTTPSVPGLDGVTLNAGDWVEAWSVDSFEINATGPIMVGQVIVSQRDDRVTDVTGDPAFVLAVPVEQFRSDYSVLTPANYGRDYITVMRVAGSVIHLDGTPIASSLFTPFGGLEYEVAYIEVEPGPHELVALGAEPFGVTMWGYDSAVSYGYPGGLDLTEGEEVGDGVP